MNVQQAFYIECTRCQCQDFMPLALVPKQSTAKERARELGWQTKPVDGKPEQLCPSCVNEV